MIGRRDRTLRPRVAQSQAYKEAGAAQHDSPTVDVLESMRCHFCLIGADIATSDGRQGR